MIFEEFRRCANLAVAVEALGIDICRLAKYNKAPVHHVNVCVADLNTKTYSSRGVRVWTMNKGTGTAK